MHFLRGLCSPGVVLGRICSWRGRRGIIGDGFKERLSFQGAWRISICCCPLSKKGICDFKYILKVQNIALGRHNTVKKDRNMAGKGKTALGFSYMEIGARYFRILLNSSNKQTILSDLSFPLCLNFFHILRYLHTQKVSVYFTNLIAMQLAAKKFPPLPSGKASQKMSLYPTVMAMFQHQKPFPGKKTVSKRELKMDSQEEISQEQPSLRRESESCKSVDSSRVRNRSCQILDRRSKKVADLAQVLLERTEIPEVSAKSWMLYEMKENRCLYGKRNYKKREIASLTKMMNLITILELIQRSGLDARKIKVRASKNSCSMIGTTAEIKYGAVYTLYDLYFGMMLPSGNDAAYLVAEVGSIMLRAMREQSKVEPETWQEMCKFQGILDTRNTNVTLFIKEMNRLSWSIGMTCSNFANPHGLSNTSNYSTALDVCKLCSYSMKNPVFRKIVSTQIHQYRCQYIAKPQTDKENMDPNILLDLFLDKSQFLGQWQNTNKMLGQGWTGIKTGVTPNAGPCLAASVSKCLNGREYQFLVVLLNSQSMQARWSEVRNLIEWTVQSRLYLQ